MGADKCTSATVEEAAKLVSNGASNKDVCEYLGIHRSTFFRWLKDPQTKNQKDLCDAIKKADIKRKLWHLQKINDAAKSGDWKASAWYLERKYPMEYSTAPSRFAQHDAGDYVDETDAMTKSLRELAAELDKQ